jgi:predicted DNA-binding ArsR family transcriptional regulator
MDSFILESMPRLRKVIVQDLDDKFEDVKERIEAIMESGNKRIEIVHKKNLQQFYIPNDFGKK